MLADFDERFAAHFLEEDAARLRGAVRGGLEDGFAEVVEDRPHAQYRLWRFPLDVPGYDADGGGTWRVEASVVGGDVAPFGF